MTGRALWTDHQKRLAVLDRRTRLVWSDWLVRHAPEVLLGKAGLAELQLWYANQPVFMGSESARDWIRHLQHLREVAQTVERHAANRHRACGKEAQARAVADETCLGPFAARAYKLGTGLVHPEVHHLSWRITTGAAAAWWAGNGWTLPADFQPTLAELNDPLRGVKLLQQQVNLRSRI